jgi:hypothetical protein
MEMEDNIWANMDYLKNPRKKKEEEEEKEKERIKAEKKKNKNEKKEETPTIGKTVVKTPEEQYQETLRNIKELESKLGIKITDDKEEEPIKPTKVTKASTKATTKQPTKASTKATKMQKGKK